MPKITFKSSQGDSYTPLPKGTYRLRCEGVEQTTAKSSGNPQLRVKLSVVGGDYDGRELSDFIPLTEKTGFRLERLLASAIPGQYDEIETGEKNDKGKPIYTYEFDTDDLIGAEFDAKLSISQNDKGEDRNDVNYIRAVLEVEAPAGEAPPAPAPRAAAAAPAAAAAAAAPAAAPAPAAPARRRMQA